MKRRHLVGLFGTSALVFAASGLTVACGSSSDGGSAANDGGSLDASTGIGSDGSPETNDGGSGAGNDGASGGDDGGGGSSEGGIRGGHGMATSSCTPADVFIGPSFNVPTISTNPGFHAIAADVNNDNISDLIQSAGQDNSVNVSIGKGDGTFTSLTYAGPQSNDNTLSTGDFNGDGLLDILYGSTDELVVMINNGDGTFKTGVPYMTGSNNPTAARAVDLNNDGKADVVMNAVTAENATSFFVVMNAGDGTLGAPVLGELAADRADVHSMEVADFNGDGKMDVVALHDVPTNTYGPCIALGNGDGTFKTSTCIGTSSMSETDLAVGDLNGDKKPDIVLSTYNLQNSETIFLNNGDGTFGGASGIAQNVNLDDVQLADMNNDGKLDVLGYSVLDGYVLLNYGKGDGTFSTTAETFAAGQAGDDHTSLTIGNYLGNGLPGFAIVRQSAPSGFDVVAPTCRTTIPPAGSLLGDGGAPTSSCATAKVTPGAVKTVATGSTYGQVLSIDMNNDGKADLVQAGGDNGAIVQIATSKGDGTFNAPTPITSSTASSSHAIAAGDLNGDGFADIILGQSGDGGLKGIAIALGKGDGTLKPFTLQPLGGETSQSSAFSSCTLADIDNDGHLDALCDDIIALGRGDGTFAGYGAPNHITGSDLPTEYRVVDVNGDGQLDVVTISSGQTGYPLYLHAGFCISLNVGNGNFATAQCTTTTDDVVGGIDAADVNGDGKVDVVVSGDTAATGLAVFLGRGDGTFGSENDYALAADHAGDLRLVDFDNDGKVDVLVIVGNSDTANQVVFIPGAGDGTFSGAPKTYAAGASQADFDQLAIGNFTGTGLTGFAVTNINDNGGIDVVTTTCSP